MLTVLPFGSAKVYVYSRYGKWLSRNTRMPAAVTGPASIGPHRPRAEFGPHVCTQMYSSYSSRTVRRWPGVAPEISSTVSTRGGMLLLRVTDTSRDLSGTGVGVRVAVGAAGAAWATAAAKVPRASPAALMPNCASQLAWSSTKAP